MITLHVLLCISNNIITNTKNKELIIYKIRDYRTFFEFFFFKKTNNY